MPAHHLNLVKFIYTRDSFIELCQLHITYQKVNSIVQRFIEEDLQNINL